VGRKKKENSKILTEMELKIMKVVWKLNEATVHDVLNELGEEYAYNTVSTIIRVLEQKGFTQNRKEGRSHFYSATITKESYEETSLENLTTNLFDDAPLSLVKRLVGSKKISALEIEELKQFLKDQD
jgi:BlaI family transcriptional regulator, penicillinase repressor